MKKFLIIPAVLLVLSGCVAQKNADQAELTAEQVQQQVQKRDGTEITPIAEESIITEVAPIDDYNSSDELLGDIDAMMTDLNSL